MLKVYAELRLATVTRPQTRTGVDGLRIVIDVPFQLPMHREARRIKSIYYTYPFLRLSPLKVRAYTTERV